MPEPFQDAKSRKYYISFSWNGQRHKRSTGSSNLEAARRAQRIVNGKVEQLKAGLIRAPHSVAVSEFIFDDKQEPDTVQADCSLPTFIEHYLQEVAPPNKAPSTCLTEKVHISHLQQFIGHRRVERLTDLNRDFFEAYKRWRHQAGRRSVTINKELGTFSTMLNVAVKSDLLDENPLSNVKRLKDDGTFEPFRTGKEIEEILANGEYSAEQIAEMRGNRYLDEEEIHRLLELVRNSKIHAFIATAAYTGMRFSEIERLKWSDVDLDHQRILARGYKGSNQQRESPRHISLHPNLAEILTELRETSCSSLVFGDEEGQPRTKYFFYYHVKRLTDGTEFEGIRYHNLRHSFCSNLATRGVDQRFIDAWVGHQTETMRKRYQHLSPDKQQEAIAKLEF